MHVARNGLPMRSSSGNKVWLGPARWHGSTAAVSSNCKQHLHESSAKDRNYCYCNGKDMERVRPAKADVCPTTWPSEAHVPVRPFQARKLASLEQTMNCCACSSE